MQNKILVMSATREIENKAQMIDVKIFPHLVLGMRSDVPNAEATLAFAKATRRVKNDSNSPFSIEELTSALAVIESRVKTNYIPLHYHAPANPTSIDSDAQIELGSININCKSDLHPYLDSSLDGLDANVMSQIFLGAALEKLLAWNWSEASTLAKACLKISNSEATRDEALNLLALTLHIDGGTDQAIAALQKAVDGEWNLNLQTNLALLATENDPLLASTHMAFLINGSKSAKERTSSANIAIGLWNRHKQRSLDTADEDETTPMPPELLSAIHGLLVRAGTSEEDFFSFGMFLAAVAPQTILSSSDINESLLINTGSGKLIKLRAQGLSDEYFGPLVRIAKENETRAPWIQTELDEWVETCLSAMTSSESVPWALYLSMTLIEQGLGVENKKLIWLRAFAIIELTFIAEDETRPADLFIDWLEQANSALSVLDLTPEEHESTRGILDQAANRLAATFLNALANEMNNVGSLAIQVASAQGRLFSSWRTNSGEVELASMHVTTWCNEASSICDRLTPYIENNELNEAIQELREVIKTI